MSINALPVNKYLYTHIETTIKLNITDYDI